MRKRRIRHVGRNLQALQHLTALGPRQRNLGVVIRHGGNPDPQRGPCGRQQKLEVRHHGRRIGRRRRQDEQPLSPAGDGAVVEDDSVLSEQHAIPRLADLQRAYPIGIHPIQEDACVRALDLDLAERGYVHDTHVLADIPAFALPRLRIGLVATQVCLRPQPEIRRSHHRAIAHMPFMHRAYANRTEMLVDMPAGQQPQPDRSVRRTKGRRAHGARRLRAQSAHDGEPVDVARLALVGSHSKRGVPLQVLHRPEVLSGGQLDVFDRYVILYVDETFAGAVAQVGRRNDQLLCLGGVAGCPRPCASPSICAQMDAPSARHSDSCRRPAHAPIDRLCCLVLVGTNVLRSAS